MLTRRQHQILTLVAAGHPNAAIGRRLGVVEDTVKTHLCRLYRQLGAHDRAHAVALAYQLGWLPMPVGSRPRVQPPTQHPHRATPG